MLFRSRLKAQGIGATVLDPRWVLPLPAAVTEFAEKAGHVVVLEDGLRFGGVGSAVATALEDSRLVKPIRTFGIPREFLDHAKRAQVLERIGLTPQQVSRDIVEWVAGTSRSNVNREQRQPRVPGIAGP